MADRIATYHAQGPGFDLQYYQEIKIRNKNTLVKNPRNTPHTNISLLDVKEEMFPKLIHRFTTNPIKINIPL